MKNTVLLILLLVGICNNTFSQSIQSNSKSFTGSSQFRNNGGAFTYELTVSAKAKRIESSPGSVILMPKASQMKITSFSFKGIDASSLETITFPVIVDASWLDFIDMDVSFNYKGNSFNSQLNGSSQTTIQNWSSAMKQLKLDCDPTFNYSCIPSANDFKNIRLVLNNASIPNGTYNRFAETDKVIDAINKHIIAQNQASQNNNSQAENGSNSNYNSQTSTDINQNSTNLNSSNQNSNTQNDYVNDNNSLNKIYEQNRKKIQASNDALNAIYQGDFKSAAFSYASAGMATEAYVSYGLDFASDIIGALKADQAEKIKNYAEDINSSMPDYLKDNLKFLEQTPSNLALRNIDYENWISLDKELRDKEVALIKKINFLNRKTGNKFDKAKDKISELTQVRLALILESYSKLLLEHFDKNKYKDYWGLRAKISRMESTYIKQWIEKGRSVYQNGGDGLFWTNKNSIASLLANTIQTERELRYNSIYKKYASEDIMTAVVFYLTTTIEISKNDKEIIKKGILMQNHKNKLFYLWLAFYQRELNYHSTDRSKIYSEEKILFLIKDCKINYFSHFPKNQDFISDKPIWKYVLRDVMKFSKSGWLKYTKRFIKNDIERIKDESGLSIKELEKQNKDCVTPDCK